MSETVTISDIASTLLALETERACRRKELSVVMQNARAIERKIDSLNTTIHVLGQVVQTIRS